MTFFLIFILIWLVVGTYAIAHYIDNRANPYKLSFNFTRVTIVIMVTSLVLYELWSLHG